jgi:hypothetical protein
MRRRGPILSLAFALLLLALLVYLLVSRTASLVLHIALVIAIVLFGLRGAGGLKRFVAEVAPSEGTIRVEAEFDEPADPP